MRRHIKSAGRKVAEFQGSENGMARMICRSVKLLIVSHVSISLGGVLIHTKLHPLGQSLYFWWSSPITAFSVIALLTDVNYFGVRENPFNKKQVVAGFEAQFTIDRLEYHVGTGKYYKMGVTGKDVTVTITLEMLREK